MCVTSFLMKSLFVLPPEMHSQVRAILVPVMYRCTPMSGRAERKAYNLFIAKCLPNRTPRQFYDCGRNHPPAGTRKSPTRVYSNLKLGLREAVTSANSRFNSSWRLDPYTPRLVWRCGSFQ
jgi:hypothetical protein